MSIIVLATHPHPSTFTAFLISDGKKTNKEAKKPSHSL